MQYFRDLAHAEFDLRKLRADTSRAQYVTELVLEVAQEEKADMPPELLQALTRGLFASSGRSRDPKHPVEMALDGVGRVKKAKISPTGGVDVEMVS